MKFSGLNIDQKILWDVNLSELDVCKHKSFILARVLNRGSLADIKSVLSYYTQDELKEAVLHNKNIGEKALHFIAQYLNLNVTDLPCYEQIRSNPYLSAH